jgi:preprotein translocase subunit YajC
MTFVSALVLAAAAPAAAAAGDANGLQDLLANPLVFMGGLLILMYFFLFRPQQQRQREHQNQVSAVKRGDSVVLSSGMIGKVVRVEEQEVGLEIAQNVTVKVMKSMIAEVRARGEPAPANANAPKAAKPKALAKTAAKDADS